MRSRRILLAAVIIFSLTAAGCLKQFVKTIDEMKTLQLALTKKFGEEKVFINIREAAERITLSVSFINSALNDQSPEERAKRAQEAANVVKTSYPRANNLHTIWVFFVQQKTSMLVFHYTQTIDYFGFDKTAARLTNGNGSGYGDPVIRNGVELTTSANYIESSKETDVSASGIQLAGVPGKDGLTVLPHYRVKGDTKTGRQPPPREVQFDFASYADQSEFQQTTPVAFIADGKQVLLKNGTFTGTNTQFCYLTIPFPAFRKMIDARQLTIKLGDREYPLNRGQLAVLQQMSAYVTD